MVLFVIDLVWWSLEAFIVAGLLVSWMDPVATIKKLSLEQIIKGCYFSSTLPDNVWLSIDTRQVKITRMGQSFRYPTLEKRELSHLWRPPPLEPLSMKANMRFLFGMNRSVKAASGWRQGPITAS